MKTNSPEPESTIRTISPLAAALSFCLLSMAGQVSADVIADALGNMPANSWQRLNINTFQSVWTPQAQRPTPHWPSSNIHAWSGAAWDSRRGNLYIWGGDHSFVGDEGNETYIFSGRTGLWSRGSLPSQITSTNGIQHTVDGVMNAPLSGESWDNVVFLNNVDRMAVIGVSREGQTWRDPSTGLTTGPYFWDPSKADPNKVGGVTGSHVNPGAFPGVLGGQMWQNRAMSNGPTTLLRGTSAYVNVNGKDVVYLTDTQDNLWRYTVHDLDPAHDTWEQIGRREMTGHTGLGGGAIDTTNNLYLHPLAEKANAFSFWDLDNPAGPLGNRAIMVIPDVVSSANPPHFGNFGVQFDPILEAFLLWDGSGSVWMLTPPEDLDSNNDGILDVATGWQLQEIEVSGAGPHIPSVYTGVYGKWVYMEEYGAYLGVIDSTSGDVFLYKPMYEEIVICEPFVTPEASTAAMLLVGLLGILASSKFDRRRT